MARPCFQVQERLSIVQSRKAQDDLLGQRRTDRLTHLTQNLPQVTRVTRTRGRSEAGHFHSNVSSRRTNTSRRRRSGSVWSS